MRTGPTALWNAALLVFAILALRDAVAVPLNGLSPGLAQAWLRAVDLAYLLFHLIAFVQWLRSRAVSAFARALAISLHLCVLLSVALADDLSAHLRSVRETVLVVSFLFAGWLAGLSHRHAPIPRGTANAILLTLLVASVPVGMVQRLLVTQIGDYWFMSYLAASRDVFDEFNYIRDGVARATGLGFSPFALGYLGLGAGMLVVTLRSLPRPSMAPSGGAARLLLPALCLTACFLAGTRLAAASLLALLLLVRTPRRWAWLLLAVLLTLGVAWAAAVELDDIGDTSLWGRIEQWTGVVADSGLLRPFGSGFATGPGDLWFDSFALNFTLTFGPAASVLFVLLIVACLRLGRRNACVPALTAIFVAQYVMQSLEYTMFMPALLLSLGLICGTAGRGVSCPSAPTPSARPPTAQRLSRPAT